MGHWHVPVGSPGQDGVLSSRTQELLEDELLSRPPSVFSGAARLSVGKAQKGGKRHPFVS